MCGAHAQVVSVPTFDVDLIEALRMVRDRCTRECVRDCMCVCVQNVRMKALRVCVPSSRPPLTPTSPTTTTTTTPTTSTTPSSTTSTEAASAASARVGSGMIVFTARDCTFDLLDDVADADTSTSANNAGTPTISNTVSWPAGGVALGRLCARAA
jgi:hypothetical protein